MSLLDTYLSMTMEWEEPSIDYAYEASVGSAIGTSAQAQAILKAREPSPPAGKATAPPIFKRVPTSPADYRRIPEPTYFKESITDTQYNDLWVYNFSPVQIGFPSNAILQRVEANVSGTGYAALGVTIHTGKSTIRAYCYNIFQDRLYPFEVPFYDADISDSTFLKATQIGVQVGSAFVGGAYLAYFNQATAVADGKATVKDLAVNYAKSQLQTAGLDGLQQGVSTMFEDYGDYFDGWNFSSGEGDVAFSDAQNVDYGFGGSFDDGQYDFDWSNIDEAAGLGGVSADVLNSSPEIYEFNATPEVTTNDFGTTWDNVFGDIDFNTAVKGVKIAQQAAGAVKAVTGKSASSGSTGAKATTGVGDILSSMSKVFGAVSGAVSGTVAGTDSQKTTAQQVRYNGQLTPTGGAKLGISTNTILIAGAALVALAFIIKVKA